MIYILDEDPKKCAEYLDDRSLDKMINDISRVLAHIHYILLCNSSIGRKHYEVYINTQSSSLPRISYKNINSKLIFFSSRFGDVS